MNRRELFKKTAGGITGVVASHLALSSCTHEKPEKEVETPLGPANDFETLRRDFPPLTKYKAYLDTAFIGLMSNQIKAAHEAFLEERLEFGPIPPDKSILRFLAMLIAFSFAQRFSIQPAGRRILRPQPLLLDSDCVCSQQDTWIPCIINPAESPWPRPPISSPAPMRRSP